MSSSSTRRVSAGELLHVLAVDDNLIDWKLVERLLRRSCDRVTAAETGIKALELLGLEKKENAFKEPEVNMIITNYCMPQMTGFDLLKRIKESSRFKDIPVIIMSSENIPTRIKS